MYIMSRVQMSWHCGNIVCELCPFSRMKLPFNAQNSHISCQPCGSTPAWAPLHLGSHHHTISSFHVYMCGVRKILHEHAISPRNTNSREPLHPGYHTVSLIISHAHVPAHTYLLPLSCSAGKGYLEDRRPSSNSDPYLVCEALARTAVLDDWSDFDWSTIPSRD